MSAIDMGALEKIVAAFDERAEAVEQYLIHLTGNGSDIEGIFEKCPQEEKTEYSIVSMPEKQEGPQIEVIEMANKDIEKLYQNEIFEKFVDNAIAKFQKTIAVRKLVDPLNKGASGNVTNCLSHPVVLLPSRRVNHPEFLKIVGNSVFAVCGKEIIVLDAGVPNVREAKFTSHHEKITAIDIVVRESYKIYAGTENGSILVFDPQYGSGPVQTLSTANLNAIVWLHTDETSVLAVDCTGALFDFHRAATLSQKSETALQILKSQDLVLGCELDSDNLTVATAFSGLVVINMNDLSRVKRLKIKSRSKLMSMTMIKKQPDGPASILLANKARVSILNRENEVKDLYAQQVEAPTCADWSQTDPNVFAVGTANKIISIWNTDAIAPLTSYDHSHAIVDIAFSEILNRLCCIDSSGAIVAFTLSL